MLNRKGLPESVQDNPPKSWPEMQQPANPMEDQYKKVQSQTQGEQFGLQQLQELAPLDPSKLGGLEEVLDQEPAVPKPPYRAEPNFLDQERVVVPPPLPTSEREAAPIAPANELSTAAIDQKIAILQSNRDTSEDPGMIDQMIRQHQAEKEKIRAEAARARQHAGRIAEIDKQIEVIKSNRPTHEDPKMLDDMVANLEKEKRDLIEGTWGERFKTSVKTTYEKVKQKFDKPAWHWLAERAKGFATVGYWEVHQAERLRQGTADAGQGVKNRAAGIREEINLRPGEAQAETERMRGILFEAGIQNPTAEDYEIVSELVTARKVRENNKLQEDIVGQKILELHKRVEKYRTARQGKEVITPENILAIEAELNAELAKLRDGRIRRDSVDYISVLRKNLDAHWKERYVYAGVEAALWMVVVKFLTTKLLAEKAVAAAVQAGPQAAPEVAKQILETGLKDTIWQESQRMLVEHGVGSPTDTMIQEVATEIAKDSGVKVVSTTTGELLWQQTAGGVARDIALQKGFLLKLGGGLKAITGIKSALAATAGIL